MQLTAGTAGLRVATNPGQMTRCNGGYLVHHAGHHLRTIKICCCCWLAPSQHHRHTAIPATCACCSAAPGRHACETGTQAGPCCPPEAHHESCTPPPRLPSHWRHLP
jgi:hypothetical protein